MCQEFPAPMLSATAPTAHLSKLIVRKHGPQLRRILAPLVSGHRCDDSIETTKYHFARGPIECTLDQQPWREIFRCKRIQELLLNIFGRNVNNAYNIHLVVRVPHCIAQAQSDRIESQFDHACVVPTLRVARNISLLCISKKPPMSQFASIPGCGHSLLFCVALLVHCTLRLQM